VLRRRDLTLLRDGMVFALPLVPAMFGVYLLNSADRLIIQGMLGAEPLARYQVAYNIGSLPILVLLALDNVWLPRIFAVEDDEHRGAVLAASRDALYKLLAPAMVALSLGSPLLLRLWAPPEFRTDQLLLVTAVVIVSAVPYAAALSVTRGLLARNATGTVATATVVAALANVVLNFALIPGLGLTGAALATLAAFALQHLLLLLRDRRSHRLNRRPGSGLVQTAVSVCLALLAVALPVTPGGLALRCVLAIACIPWFALVVHRIRPMRGSRSVSQ
jgi:O-antigen/teichoic acid export membrane protein